jgi:hypothetical protein
MIYQVWSILVSFIQTTLALPAREQVSLSYAKFLKTVVPCIQTLYVHASGRQTPLVKENWEGRRPKTRDKHGSPESYNSIQPRRKLGRTLLDLASMNNEVEVTY